MVQEHPWLHGWPLILSLTKLFGVYFITGLVVMNVSRNSVSCVYTSLHAWCPPSVSSKDTHEYYTSAFMQGSSSDYWFDLAMLHAANDSQVVLSSLSGSSRTVLVSTCTCPVSVTLCVCMACFTHIFRLHVLYKYLCLLHCFLRLGLIGTA